MACAILCKEDKNCDGFTLSKYDRGQNFLELLIDQLPDPLLLASTSKSAKVTWNSRLRAVQTLTSQITLHSLQVTH